MQSLVELERALCLSLHSVPCHKPNLCYSVKRKQYEPLGECFCFPRTCNRVRFFEPELKHVPPLVVRADMQMNSLTLKLLVPQLRGLKSVQKRVKHITAREKRGEREKREGVNETNTKVLVTNNPPCFKALIAKIQPDPALMNSI